MGSAKAIEAPFIETLKKHCILGTVEGQNYVKADRIFLSS